MQLFPADSLAPITFLNAKVKLEEDKQLIVKNNESLSDNSIVTVDTPETAIITQRYVKEKLQILKDTADSGKGNGFQEIKTEIERQILAEVEKETIELDEENLLQEQLTQRLAREEEKERQMLEQQVEAEEHLEVEHNHLEEEEEQRLAKEKTEKQEKFKEYQEQQVREVLLQLKHQRQLEKQRLAKETLDKLEKGIALLEETNKYTIISLKGKPSLIEIPLVREAKKQLGLQKVAVEKGVIPGLEKLVTAITRTAEVIQLETQRLRQVEAEKARIKLDQIKVPLTVALSN